MESESFFTQDNAVVDSGHPMISTSTTYTISAWVYSDVAHNDALCVATAIIMSLGVQAEFILTSVDQPMQQAFTTATTTPMLQPIRAQPPLFLQGRGTMLLQSRTELLCKSGLMG